MSGRIREDLTGKRFGKLVVLYEAEKVGEKTHWICKCDCGNLKNVSSIHLKNGDTKSCGLCEHKFIGKRFGKLEVLEISRRERTKSGSLKIYFDCVCACGNKVEVVYQQLKEGKTISCGCYRKQKVIENNTTHNQSNTRLYKIYMGMKKRCYNKKCEAYSYYGGKGIKICDEWSSYETFMQWALSNGYSDDLSIDRIDSNGDYEPNNCRWVSIKEQANNKSNNTVLEFNGRQMTIAQWSEVTGIEKTVISRRIHLGWDIQRALTEPVHNTK